MIRLAAESGRRSGTLVPRRRRWIAAAIVIAGSGIAAAAISAYGLDEAAPVQETLPPPNDPAHDALERLARSRGTLVEFLQPAPILTATAGDRALYQRICEDVLKRTSRPAPKLASSSESYFWVQGARLQRLMECYEYSRDPRLLSAFVGYMKQILDDRYVHPDEPETWIGWFHYEQGPRPRYYMPIHGALLYYVPALRFIAAVRADPNAAAHYGDLAESWFRDIVNVEFAAWDRRDCWRELSRGAEPAGWYVKLSHFPDADTGELIPLPPSEAGTTLAYNKVHALIEAFCLAYRMTGDAAIRARIEKCERFFRGNWREDSDHVEWNYRDFSGPWDYAPPGEGNSEHEGRDTWKGWFVHGNGGYYNTDLRAIVDCYNLDIVFSRRDLERLVETNLEFMWNGDMEAPAYRRIDGKDDGGVLWYALAQFDERVLALWKMEIDAFARQKGRPHDSAMAWLLAKAQPRTWAQKHAALREPGPVEHE